MLGEHATDERVDAFLQAGPIVLDYLEQKTSVRFAAPPVHPDYKHLPGAAIGGRALGAVPFDGRQLGDDFARVRPPRREFMVLGGMMVGKADIPALLAPFRNWTNFRHVVGLLARHALDRLRYKRGTRLIMGNALVARLFDSIRRAGVDLRYETGSREPSATAMHVVGAVFIVFGNSGNTRPQRRGAGNGRHRLEPRTSRTAVSPRPRTDFHSRLRAIPETACSRPNASTPSSSAISIAPLCGCRARS